MTGEDILLFLWTGIDNVHLWLDVTKAFIHLLITSSLDFLKNFQGTVVSLKLALLQKKF